MVKIGEGKDWRNALKEGGTGNRLELMSPAKQDDESYEMTSIPVESYPVPTKSAKQSGKNDEHYEMTSIPITSSPQKATDKK
ncbi:hypothetical protein [Dysgonomonas sp. Marseille-P4361]|uniref:hypothetical protein n=1 Tax=Dysgonomonas sp. Marseille-P4361 TaxID=2161820 RepID=UPI000D555CF1|nr:hypothetical protein [Dysgonomonas sp. Marseille-P4361]